MTCVYCEFESCVHNIDAKCTKKSISIGTENVRDYWNRESIFHPVCEDVYEIEDDEED